MFCMSCRQFSRRSLCDVCLRTLTPATPRWLATGGVAVRSAFVHEAAARAVIHRLKYDGLAAAAEVLAAAMAPMVSDASALVPVPRVVARRVTLGVDPALELCRAIRARTGIPIVEALRPALMGRRRAGKPRQDRAPARFAGGEAVRPGAVLIDDVVTTGMTLSEASAASGIRAAVTATSQQLFAQVPPRAGRRTTCN